MEAIYLTQNLNVCIKRSSFHLVFSKWTQDTPEREAIEADGGGDGVQAGAGGCALEANSLKIDEIFFFIWAIFFHS